MRCKYCETTDNIAAFVLESGMVADLRFDTENATFDLRISESQYPCVDWVLDESIDIKYCPFCGINLFEDDVKSDIPMSTYNNIKFNDYTRNDDGTYWMQICKACVDKHKINDSVLSECPSTSICGVLGCENEADYHLDSNNFLIK